MANIFDKMIVGINQGISSVSESSKNLVEKAKINTQLQDIERERNLLLQNIGTLVYNLQLSGELTVEKCSGMCFEVQRYNEQIAALQGQLKALEKSAQPAPAGAAPADGIRCSCGFVNKPDARFCAKCGQTINAG